MNIKPITSALRSGELIALVDDLAPPHRAYIIGAAEFISDALMTRMVNTARGVICAALSEQRAKELRLPPMLSRKQASGADFTVSVESRQGVTTGISAADRAATLRALARSTDSKLDLVTPGHIFPLRAKSGGVLVRSGIAEAAVDLLTIANLLPVAGLSHCLNGKGEFLDRTGIDLLLSSEKLPAINISDIISYRLRSEKVVDKIASAELPTSFAGNFMAHCFLSRIDGTEHLALVKGDIATHGEAPVLVRVQAEHHFSDLLSLQENSGRKKIELALRKIGDGGCGVFVYVRHPRKGSLTEAARNLATNPTSTSPAGELRENGIGAQILSALGIKRIRLLTNSTREIPGISAFNLEVVDRVPFHHESHRHPTNL